MPSLLSRREGRTFGHEHPPGYSYPSFPRRREFTGRGRGGTVDDGGSVGKCVGDLLLLSLLEGCGMDVGRLGT